MTAALSRARRTTRETPAQSLRGQMAAARVCFTWFGTRKTLTAEQKAEAAEAFGAEGPFLSAGKKLLDTRHPKFKAVSTVKHQTVAYWRSVSLPFPEPGLRLIRQDAIEAFDRTLGGFREELNAAVQELDAHFDTLKSGARDRLGRLFQANDYPSSLVGLFDVGWEFPSVEPPNYLAQLSPELYEAECRRVQTRFDEAVELAENAFLDELNKLVGHLTERLAGTTDGQPKVFRDSAIGNLQEFFSRFQSLNVRSNADLDLLVGDCQRIVTGVEPQELRDNRPLRESVSQQLSAVTATLDGLLVDRPRRRVLRTPR